MPVPRLILISLFLTGLFAADAAADQVSLEPSQDAFVCDCIPGATNPMLGNQYLAQGKYQACYNRTFIMWELSSIPAGATIDSAEFRIFCAQFYGSPSGQMAYYCVTEAWNENTVNYSNMPGFTPDGAIFTSSWPSGSSWHSVDVTEFVIDWYAGTTDNYGFYCHSTGCTTSISDCAFYSSRVTPTSYRPKLVVTYTPQSALEETTWGNLKTVL